MKKVLVLGASGGIGYALVNELVSRGIEVVAFARGKEKLEKLYGHEKKVTIFQGDALVDLDVTDASQGVDVIFHAVSFPYQEWEQTHPICVDVMIRAAKSVKAKIAFVDNVYAYGRQLELVTEETEKAPHTKKGKLRLEMESTLKNSNVPTLIVHMPDVYGPNCANTILHETLKNVIQNKTANFVGSMKVAREYLYTLDAAKTMIELASREDTYNQNWNIPASRPITGEELLELFRKEFGYTKSFRSISKSMIRLMGIFQPFMKEMVEMMYLTKEPVVLSGKKYEASVGALSSTTYQEGLSNTLKWMEKESKKELLV
ncbi:SDR family NAD(P)-dependent oxidoreductase [Anaerobacillus isosaccharinicus]|uniref:SDR family NAD(P)-dependent oxidoreductase n=1 Tax=Anaerobacillus isosaccharinicus TaxID=1532552 RepID=A0A1S2LJC5_9BACI|nr:SDR family NAD(P)-dependent oxidoreductase [Anaerobacillus isosaccharinicus]MBA5586192.1 SDR family NAD(P)-dependent oxidoreductase [Anaerobacillus isosaccharinicus]QOY35546.1 SDR family NAD(P)-dependent oxidoreductase [Anaerobacillus isosaccharinicus]